MKVSDKEHHELMQMFEKIHTGFRADKEPKEFWNRGIIYQDGMYNKLFLAFRQGYAFGKTTT